jgi:hypothetical protein
MKWGDRPSFGGYGIALAPVASLLLVASLVGTELLGDLRLDGIIRVWFCWQPSASLHEK